MSAYWLEGGQYEFIEQKSHFIDYFFNQNQKAENNVIPERHDHLQTEGLLTVLHVFKSSCSIWWERSD